MRILTILLVPICLGQLTTAEGQFLDPAWEGHNYLYATKEGVETDVCGLCAGPWEPVTYWVAGLEAICGDEDWQDCLKGLLRCAVTLGC